MRFKKIFILFVIFSAFAISQKKGTAFLFHRINDSPCEDFEVYFDGKLVGTADVLGKYLFSYDSTMINKYQVEVRDTTEVLSKRFTVTLGKGQKNPIRQIIYMNELGAYLNVEELKGDFKKTLNNFKDAGVTEVFVPVFADGKAFYPSKVKGIESENRDYLKEIITECKKLCMRVSVTINTLNWGSKNSGEFPPNDYLQANKKGEYNSGEEGKFKFVSPAHPEVIRILTEITREIVNNYKDLNGINFDYLRFKKGSYKKLANEDFGFDKNIVELFKNSNKIDPNLIKFDTTKESNWFKWIELKENLITNLFVKLMDEIKNGKSKLKVSLTIDPSYPTERGKNLTCANAYEIEQYILPDYYFLEVTKKDIANDMRMIDQYLPSGSPFENVGVNQRRREAFIPIIKDGTSLSNNELDKMLNILAKKGMGARFNIYDQIIFNDIKNRQRLIFIATN
jgi:hypothetical protein